VVECFPTASWTRWSGGRNGRSRAAWSTGALATLGVSGVPRRTSQDARDAIAAALTARCFDQGSTVSFGEIVVPV
jgi:predicted nuclease with RNAse H fold